MCSELFHILIFVSTSSEFVFFFLAIFELQCNHLFLMALEMNKHFHGQWYFD